MKPELGLDDKARAAVVGILNTLLADEHVLYVKTRNYHWNVTGPHFSEYHKLFESQYEALGEAIDEVAERARALGGAAEATMAGFLKKTRLKEGKAGPAADMIRDLLADHEALARALRADVDACATKHGDAGTGDFLTGLMEAHEKTAWMLRATLEK